MVDLKVKKFPTSQTRYLDTVIISDALFQVHAVTKTNLDLQNSILLANMLATSSLREAILLKGNKQEKALLLKPSREWHSFCCMPQNMSYK